jgi:hypothetical protein
LINKSNNKKSIQIIGQIFLHKIEKKTFRRYLV